MTLPPLGDVAVLTRTRHAWHRVAEHVLAAARHRATGRIGLHWTPGGFGTPTYERDGASEVLQIIGNELLVHRDGSPTRHPLTTVADAAQAVGIEPGAPADVYAPTTELDRDAPLEIDLGAARVLSDWLEMSWSVLEELGRDTEGDAAPSDVTLWPEHFDAAIEFGSEARRVRGTFGASFGDAQHPEPYAYVTHWVDVPEHEYWNDTAFAGASVHYSELAATTAPRDAMVAFFRAGAARLNATQE